VTPGSASSLLIQVTRPGGLMYGNFRATPAEKAATIRRTGVYTSGRATRNLDRFPIARDGDTIVVDIGRVYRSDQDAAGWAAAHVTL
jgi:hypothetical protein